MKAKTTTLFYLLLLAFQFVSSIISAQKFPGIASNDRIAAYEIKADLDADKKIISGSEYLRWRNSSPDVIKELNFHLYLNAFKNNRSTFMKESGGQHRGISLNPNQEKAWGYIDILSMKRVNGEDLTSKISFIQPDDNNAEDQSVISVPLAAPLKPGEEIVLQIEFRSKLPQIFARTGFAEDYFLVGQWFPKIGVYEYPGIRYAEKGGWNCHQFHSNSEFYADFADYKINITVPSDYLFGSVGETVNRTKSPDGRKTTYNVKAENVLDFAWTVSPKFKIVEDSWFGVKIKLMMQPEHYSQADRHLHSLKAALEYLDRHLGKYPYSTITVVDPPMNGFGSGGMEYPTFITAGTLWGLPDGIKLPEMVTVHEFGHNYFMGILATNEFEEAFLDEGFNQYFETRIMDYTYGVNTSLINCLGYTVGDFEYSRAGYTGMGNPKIGEIFRKSWEYPVGGYGSLTYMKTAVMMKTLEGLVGIKTMDEIMKAYYEKWKFKHPCAKDFIAIVNEVVNKNLKGKFGDNMNWYFDQVLNGNDVCDYKLASISNVKTAAKNGLFDKEKGKEFINGLKEESKNYKSSVVVYRMGEVKLPVEVLVHFHDGKEILENWNGLARTAEFKYEGKSKVQWAKIDPYNKIPLDINLVNNSLTTETEKGVYMKYSAKILFWLQNVMLIFSMMF